MLSLLINLIPLADLDSAMDVDDECGGMGGVGGSSYELLVDDGFVYDQVEHTLDLCDIFI